MSNQSKTESVTFSIVKGPDRFEFLCGLGDGLVQTAHGLYRRHVIMGITNGTVDIGIDVILVVIGCIDESWVELGAGDFSFRARVQGPEVIRLLSEAFEQREQRESLAEKTVFVAGRYNPFRMSGELWVSNIQGIPIQPWAPGTVRWELEPTPDFPDVERLKTPK
jgi:hypothetical protein